MTPRLTVVAPPAPTRLATPREVAELLRCSPSMIRLLNRRGELPAVYVGRLPRFHPDDVAAYLERSRTGGTK